MAIRTWLIQKTLGVNEYFIFYPKLKEFYKKRLTNPKPIIIDIGSNRGQSIDFFLNLNPNSQIFGFEPNKILFKFLSKKYEKNNKILLSNNGISQKKGKLLFQENIMNETSTFEELNFDSTYLKKKAAILGVSPANIIVDRYEVEVITLHSFIENNPDRYFDLLKIDVEGHEYDCLAGLFNGTDTVCPIQFIQIESHNDDMYVSKGKQEAIDKLLKSNGFEMAAKIKHGFGNFHEIIYENKYKK